MWKILLCAFDPFGGESINPALLAVRLVNIEGAELEKCEVPTVFYRSIDTVIKKIDKLCPDAVVMIGQAGGRAQITPERVAINISDASIDDNEGNRPCDEPIEAGAPAAYFSSLPIKDIVDRLKAENIPAAISNSAGTFVCNHLMYGVLRHIDKKGLQAVAGFIHIPYLPQQIENKQNMPFLPLETSVKAVEIAVKTVAGLI